MLELPPRSKSANESIPREIVPGIGRNRTIEASGTNAEENQRSIEFRSRSQLENEASFKFSRIVQLILDIEKSTSESLTTKAPGTIPDITRSQPFSASPPPSTDSGSFCKRKCHLLLFYGVIIGLLVVYHVFNLIGALSTTDSIAVWFSVILDFISITTLVTIPACSPLSIILGSSLVSRQQNRIRNELENNDISEIDLSGDENEGSDENIYNNDDSFTLDNSVTKRLLIYLSGCASSTLSTDATTTRMWWGSVVACFINLLGEAIFIHKGWTDAQERSQQRAQYLHEPDEGQVAYNEQKYEFYETETQTPPREMALLVVYMASAVTVSIILTLGSGYVALVHNMLAYQLECLAQLVNHQSTSRLLASPISSDIDGENRSVEGDEQEESSMLLQRGRMVSSPIRNGNYELPRLSHTGKNLHAEFDHVLAARHLFEIHNEFRYRIDSLKGLHRRFAIVLATACLVTIILVSQGYIEQSKTGERIAQTPILVVALISTFYGLSYSLWSMVYAVGRVVYVGRERVGHEVKRWALVLARRELETKQRQLLDSKYRPRHPTSDLKSDLALDVAQYVCSFPIRLHIAIFEFGEDSIKAVMLLLFGLAAAFLGIHVPEIL